MSPETTTDLKPWTEITGGYYVRYDAGGVLRGECAATIGRGVWQCRAYDSLGNQIYAERLNSSARTAQLVIDNVLDDAAKGILPEPKQDVLPTEPRTPVPPKKDLPVQAAAYLQLARATLLEQGLAEYRAGAFLASASTARKIQALDLLVEDFARETPPT